MFLRGRFSRKAKLSARSGAKQTISEWHRERDVKGHPKLLFPAFHAGAATGMVGRPKSGRVFFDERAGIAVFDGGILLLPTLALSSAVLSIDPRPRCSPTNASRFGQN